MHPTCCVMWSTMLVTYALYAVEVHAVYKHSVEPALIWYASIRAVYEAMRCWLSSDHAWLTGTV